MDERRIVLGRINGLFGVHGFVKVYSYTTPPANILTYPHWQLALAGIWQRLRVVQARPQGKTLVAQLADPDTDAPITDRDRAARLVDADVAVARAELPALPEGQHYWADLVGLSVCNTQGQALGDVVGLLDTGMHGVLDVRGPHNYLIPLLYERYVLDVDLRAGRMTVQWHRDDY